jgi:hypothetical protein
MYLKNIVERGQALGKGPGFAICGKGPGFVERGRALRFAIFAAINLIFCHLSPLLE